MQNQHYVPRVYLKPFTYDSSHLYVYDKATNELLPTSRSSIKSTASETNFYTLPEDLTQTGDADEVESWLQGVDNQFAALRSGVEDHLASGYPINQKLRKELSSYIGIQFTRTRMYRETMAFAYNMGVEDLNKELVVPLVRPTREQIKAFQVDHMQRTMAPILAEDFASRLWFLGLNESPTPFFTSDSPVVWQETFDAGAHNGDIVLFPITSRCLLMMYDGEIAEKLSKRLFQPWILTDKQITGFNDLQVLQSDIRVYSQVDHTDQCRKVCEQNPNLRSIDSPRKTAEFLMNTDVAKAEKKLFIKNSEFDRRH